MPADEFDIIARYFAPLATSSGARGLVDDVAVLETTGRLVVTTDAIVEGVHFLPGDPIDTIAKKALRVNLSDLAAKGAKPLGVVLTLIWPQSRPAAQIADFARGLGEDLKHYGIALLGGDTTSTPGPLTISITAFGEPLGARTPSRADARAGQQVWVTGEIGDGFLGLMSLTTAPAVFGATPADQSDAFAAHMRARYRTPEPPVAFAETIARFASATADVSDGLIADAAKIAAASGVALRLDAEAIPLSAPGHAFAAQHADGLARLVTGGDDYQILFTAAPEHRRAILEAGQRLGLAVALIGDVTDGQGVRLIGSGGSEMPLPSAGHRHALGS
jgi:thiamine-monophosphate kinase